MKLVRELPRRIRTSSFHRDIEDDENTLPEDVKEGHLAVHVVDGGELRRFVVELSNFTHPGFAKLLEQAEEEYGFEQTGVLAIPCTCSDLQSVLGSIEKH